MEESNLKSPRVSLGRSKIDLIQEERDKIKNEYKMLLEIKRKTSKDLEDIFKNRVKTKRKMPRTSSEERSLAKDDYSDSEINEFKESLKMKETIIEEDTQTLMNLLGEIQKEREELELKISLESV